MAKGGRPNCPQERTLCNLACNHDDRQTVYGVKRGGFSCVGANGTSGFWLQSPHGVASAAFGSYLSFGGHFL